MYLLALEKVNVDLEYTTEYHIFTHPQNRLPPIKMALNLLDINDDCLLEIFSNLSILELKNVASACSRFKTIARDVFLRRQKSNHLEMNLCVHSVAQRRHTAAILRHFGDMLTKVKVIFWDGDKAHLYNTLAFNLMAKYCTGPLESLHLVDCKILQSDAITDGRMLFRDVKELYLDDAGAVEGSLLADTNELKSLELNLFSSTNVIKYLSNDYPHLESLTLNNRQSDRSEIDIVPFLKRHPDLIELELSGGGKYDFSAISGYPCLKKLTISDCGNSNLLPIAQLNNLATLKLTIMVGNGSAIGLLKTLKSSQSLEALELSGAGLKRYSYGDRTELMATLLRFTNLKRLSFKSLEMDDDLSTCLHRARSLRVLSIGGPRLFITITSGGLVDLVQNLPNLEQLSLHPLFNGTQHPKFSETTYLRICEIYRKRNKKLSMFDFDTTDVWLKKLNRKEPFAGFDQQEFVQFVTLDCDH